MNKNKKAMVLVIVLAVLWVLLMACGGLFLWKFLKHKFGPASETAQIVTQMEPDNLLLQADQTNFRVGEGGQIELTVISRKQTTGTVRISDEKNQELLTVELQEMDGQGIAVGTLDIFETEPRRMELTAKLDGETSASLSVYSSPEVTISMIAECMQVADELGNALIAAGFETVDENALDEAEAWLKSDARIADIRRQEGAVYYLTNAGIAGSCMLTPEEGVYGSSAFQMDGETSNVFRRWSANQGEPMDGEYLHSLGTVTNDRVLVLRPMYNAPAYAYDDEDSNKERGKTTKLASNACHNEVHAEQAAIISEALHSPYKPEIYSDADAVQVIMRGEMSDYGVILMNSHGWPLETGDDVDPWVWSFMMQGGFTLNMLDGTMEQLAEQHMKMMGVDPENYDLFYSNYDTHWEARDVRMFINSDLGKEARDAWKEAGETVIFTNVQLFGTINLLTDIYQNKDFDNSFVYFGICYSFADLKVPNLFLNRGAVSYGGYYAKIVDAVEHHTLETYVKEMSTYLKKQDRYQNLDESVESWVPVYRLLWRKFFKVIAIGDQTMQVAAWYPEYTFEGHGKLKGNLINLEEKPVGQAQVTLHRWLDQRFVAVETAESDANGEFEFERIPYGVYAVTTNAVGYKESLAECVFGDESYNAGTIVLEGENPYYPYIRDVLKPQYGLFDVGERSADAYGFDDYGWDDRTGILSAAIADMDANGVDDMLLLRVEREQFGENRMRQNLIADMYTIEQGEIVLKDTLNLDSFNNCEIHESWLALYTEEGKPGCDLFMQSYAKGCFVDYLDPIYGRYHFDGEKLRKVFYMKQSEGGTSEAAYSNFYYNEATGAEESELVWGDGLYVLFSGKQGIYNKKGLNDMRDVYKAFMKDYMPCEMGEPRNEYPSYRESSDMLQIAEFANAGSWRGGEFTMNVLDYTALREELEKLEEQEN